MVGMLMLLLFEVAECCERSGPLRWLMPRASKEKLLEGAETPILTDKINDTFISQTTTEIPRATTIRVKTRLPR